MLPAAPQAWLCALQRLLCSTPSVVSQVLVQQLQQLGHKHSCGSTASTYPAIQPVPLSLLTARQEPHLHSLTSILPAVPAAEWGTTAPISSSNLLQQLSQQQIHGISPASPPCSVFKAGGVQAQQHRHVATITSFSPQQFTKGHTDELLRVRLLRAGSAAELQQVLLEVPGGPSTTSLITALTAPCLERVADKGSRSDPKAHQVVLWMLQQLRSRAGSLTAEQVITVLCALRQHSYAASVHLSWPLQLLNANNYSLLTQLQPSLSPEGHKSPASQLVKLCSSLTHLRINNTYSKHKYMLDSDFDVYKEAVAAAIRLYRQSEPHGGQHAIETPRKEVSAMLELMRSLSDAPERWMPSAARKAAGQQIVHALMTRLPWWYPEAATRMVSCMAKLQLVNDPAALIYATAFVHACRDHLHINDLSLLLYSYGLLAKSNSLFAGSLVRPEFSVLAEQAQAAVQPFAASATRRAWQRAEQQPIKADHNREWTWPAPSVKIMPLQPQRALSNISHQEGVQVPGTQAHVQHAAPSLATYTPDNRAPVYQPVLHVLPAAPGTALHWQDSPPSTCLTSTASASPDSAELNKLKVLSELDRNDSMMAQVLLDITAAVAQRMKQADAVNISQSLWGCMQLRLFSGPLLTTVLKEFATTAPRGSLSSLNMCAMSLANLHVMGTTGPVISKLADRVAQIPRAFEMTVKPTGVLVCEQIIPNMCWALAISDQAGSLAWRKQLLAWLKRMYDAGVMQRVPPVIAHQVVTYLEVLRELEWEKSRQAGDQDVPPTVWDAPPPQVGLLPWQQPWLSELTQQLLHKADNFSRPSASAFQRGLGGTLNKLRHRCGPNVWHEAQYEASIPGSGTSIDLLLTSNCGRVKVAVEAEGPWHFAVNDSALLLGNTARRVRAIARRGYLQLQVPYWQWAPLRFWPEKVAYIQERLHMLLSEAYPDDPQLVTRLVGRRVDDQDVMAQMQASLFAVTPTEVVLGKRKELVSLLDMAQEWLRGLQIGRQGVKHAEGRTHLDVADMMRASSQDMHHLLLQQQKAASHLQDLSQQVQQQPQQAHGRERVQAQARYVMQVYESLQLGLERVRTLKRVQMAVQRLRANLAEDLFLRQDDSQRARQTGQQNLAAASQYYVRPGGESGRSADSRIHDVLADVEDCILWVLRTELKLRATNFNAKASQGGEAVAKMMSRVMLGQQQAVLGVGDAADSSSGTAQLPQALSGYGTQLEQQMAAAMSQASMTGTASGTATITDASGSSEQIDMLEDELASLRGLASDDDLPSQPRSMHSPPAVDQSRTSSRDSRQQHAPTGQVQVPILPALSLQTGDNAQAGRTSQAGEIGSLPASKPAAVVQVSEGQPQQSSRHQASSSKGTDTAQQSASAEHAGQQGGSKRQKSTKRRASRRKAEDEAAAEKVLARMGFLHLLGPQTGTSLPRVT